MSQQEKQRPHRDITSRHDYTCIQLTKGGNHCAEFVGKIVKSYIPC